MTALEEDVRRALHDMAGESRATPLLGPVLHRHEVVARRRRLAGALAAVVAVAAVAVGATAVQDQGRSQQLPAQQPPKVFRTSLDATAQPGRARLVLTLGGSTHLQAAPAYVLPVTTDHVVRLRPRQQVAEVGLQRVSRDGRYLLQLGVPGANDTPGLAMIDLRSGRARLLPDLTGGYAELSPDDATVAVRDDRVLSVVDVATGHTRVVRRLSHRQELSAVAGGQLGWSPDSRLIAVKAVTDTLVVDLRGNVTARFSGTSPVNGSQSWSPDGRSLLLYDGSRSGYRVADVDGATSTDLDAPAGADRALGWTGDRIVWLAGSPGAQRLVTTDRTGHGEAPWMRIDVGSQVVDSVTWSQALTG